MLNKGAVRIKPVSGRHIIEHIAEPVSTGADFGTVLNDYPPYGDNRALPHSVSPSHRHRRLKAIDGIHIIGDLGR
ncbi:hypothetical protein D3C85_1640330 [compost metagenome]